MTALHSVATAGSSASSLLVALAVPVLCAAQAAPRPIGLGDAHTIQSAVMGENREIQVSLPESYGRTAIAYPVVFVLDGSSHLLHATATTRFLASARNRIPEMIVVAIPNTNRNRDLTPGPGAAKFQRFFADELIPWVERTYRAAPDRVILGHSLGGSFVVHTLLNRPDLFDTYVAASAPIWRYDSLMAHAKAGLARAAQAGATLYLTVGQHENERLREGLARFAAYLRSGEITAPKWSYTDLADEDHSSTSQRSLYAALEQRYAEWRFPFFEDTTELAAVGGLKALEANYERQSKHFWYRVPPPEGRLLQVGGIYLSAARHDETMKLAEDYKSEYPAMAERLINQTGYDLLRRGELQRGVRVFQKNVEWFPNSTNVHDSLGDAYCRTGDTASALESYRRAVRVAETRSHPRLAFYKQKVERACRPEP
jgi:predicted alpha/beta superfamily hydrolase